MRLEDIVVGSIMVVDPLAEFPDARSIAGFETNLQQGTMIVFLGILGPVAERDLIVGYGYLAKTILNLLIIGPSDHPNLGVHQIVMVESNDHSSWVDVGQTYQSHSIRLLA